MKQKFEISGEIVEQPSVDPGPVYGCTKYLRITIRGPRMANQAEGHDNVVRMIPINHIVDQTHRMPVGDVEGFIAREAGNAFASWIRDRMRFESENGIRLNAISALINRRDVQRESRRETPRIYRTYPYQHAAMDALERRAEREEERREILRAENAARRAPSWAELISEEDRRRMDQMTTAAATSPAPTNQVDPAV